jgi:hypothetical protein
VTAPHAVRSAVRRLRWELSTAFLERAKYSRVPGVWSAAYLLLSRARTRAAVFVCSGAAAGGGELSIAVAGSRSLAEEIAGVFLTTGTRIRAVVPAPLTRPRNLSSGADLEVARIHPWHAARWSGAGWRVVPRRVRFDLDLGAPWKPRAGRRGRALANDLRKIARAGFAFEEVPARDALETYRTRMMAPYARARFGGRASLRVGRAARRGTIHFALRDGVRLGGILLVPRGETLCFPSLGVLDGREDLVHEGLHAALYLHAIEWARARGFRTLDAGVASGLASDGIHRWKRKWGFVPREAPLSDLLALRARTDAGRRALARRGFLDGGEAPK